MSVLVNGMMWKPSEPRVLSVDFTRQLFESQRREANCKGSRSILPQKLIAIAEISADLGGPVEFMTKCTTIDQPFCIYEPHTGTSHFGTYAAIFHFWLRC